MKLLNFFVYLMLCFQTLGLISCKPEEAVQTPDFRVVDSFSIKNLKGDLTARRAHRGQTQSLTSQILLTEDSRLIAENREVRLLVQSECTSLQERKSKATRTHLQPSFPLFELVAEDILLELPQLQKIWRCDFHFTASDAPGERSDLLLNF